MITDGLAYSPIGSMLFGNLMKCIKSFFIFIFFIFISSIRLGHCTEWMNQHHLYQAGENLKDDIFCDFSIYFGRENLIDLGLVFLTIGTMANTNVDRSLSNHWQKGIRSPFTNAFFKVPNGIGKFNYVATYLATMAIGHWQSEKLAGHLLYNWGYRSIRTLLIVGIQDPFYGWFIGNGRPCDGKHTATWKFFNRGGKCGCSGHTFNGAIPFITAAMMADSLPVKIGFYVLSTLPGLARINAHAHYPSQVILAWSMAYLAARSVHYSEEAREECCFKAYVIPTHRGAQIQASMRF